MTFHLYLTALLFYKVFFSHFRLDGVLNNDNKVNNENNLTLCVATEEGLSE